MKKASLLMGEALLLSCGLMAFAGCNNSSGNDSSGTDSTDSSIDSSSSDAGSVNDEIQTDAASLDYAFNKLYSSGELKDTENGFSSSDDLTGARFCVNGEYTDTFTSYTSRQDIKLELYNDDAARIVNVSAGMTFTLPSTEISADYIIAKYQTQYEFDDSVLTVSMNSNNPYTSNPNPWYTYCSEWLIRHLNNDDYIENNGLERMNGTQPYEFTETHAYGDLTVKEGYDVYRYDIRVVDDAGVVERPYYNIAIIRVESNVKEFAMFVMKSETDKAEVMDDLVQSYEKITPKGIQKNYFDAGKPQGDPNWNEETKNYYELISNTKNIQWGVFSYSMPGTSDSLHAGQGNYDTILNNSIAMKEALEEAWDYTYDIYPTYTHLGWGNQKHYFPLDMARELAGGNGVNGKPVLQFTYQFTLNNNIVADEVTPMFDILRGEFDEQFRELAKDIKEYGEPVLFRLNNEMNTDWTSYSGMMTLCDPDVFIITWQRLYNIFIEEGVDNCIWIWNPIAESCPYSSWGEDLCFFPGVEYVNFLGATNYEMNNYSADTAAEEIVSFAERYSSLYEKNLPAFSQWGMIISEFACGSGGNASGDLGRNRDEQAKWVADMFAAFAADEMEPWAASIKGAVWFNVNDYASSTVITNRLQIFDPNSKNYDDLAGTIEAFREGFASLKK